MHKREEGEVDGHRREEVQEVQEVRQVETRQEKLELKVMGEPQPQIHHWKELLERVLVRQRQFN